MSDLFQGQTMTESFKCISAGSAATFTFGFEPDKVIFYNLTDWKATAGTFPISVWFRTLTTDTDAYQQAVLKSDGGNAFNFIFEGTNGFTVANTTGGVTSYRTAITGITQADPCVVTAASHGLSSGMQVRITDLGPQMPTARGMDQLNDNRFNITVINANTFSLQDPITDEDIDSTAYVAYVTGGSVMGISRTQALSSAFEYDPITYKLTAGSAIMATDGDIFFIETIRYGNRIFDLGDLG